MSLEPYGSPLSLNTIDNISSLGDFVKQNPPGRYIFEKKVGAVTLHSGLDAAGPNSSDFAKSRWGGDRALPLWDFAPLRH